jgi:hypothetical protein
VIALVALKGTLIVIGLIRGFDASQEHSAATMGTCGSSDEVLPWRIRRGRAHDDTPVTGASIKLEAADAWGLLQYSSLLLKKSTGNPPVTN